MKISNLYFKLRACTPIWKAINASAIVRHKLDPLPLSGLQKAIVHSLQTHGIAIVPISVLAPGEPWLDSFQRYVSSRKTLETEQTKYFLESYWSGRVPVTYDNPFAAFALSPQVLAIVNEYMGMYSKLFYLTLNKTTVRTGPRVFSQKLHRDPEDMRQVKMFVYLSNVDEGAGPFSYVPDSVKGKRYGGLYPQEAPIGSYPPPEAVSHLEPCDFLGRAGTIIFADTSGLHSGGYATVKERLMFTAGYRSTASPTPTHVKNNRMDKWDFYYLTPAQKFAATENKLSRLTQKMFDLATKK